MSKDIIVLAPNGRRQTVRCTPNTTILQVLEDVCKKQGYDPGQYDLKHHNKILDLSTVVRFTGLPNKANLEMVETERKRQDHIVTVGLQLENGERRIGDFSPQTSLHEVLENLAGKELEVCHHPTLVYTRREVRGLSELQQTTLRQLGLTGGRAVLRLIDKSPEELETQANVSSVLPSKQTQTDEPIPSTSKDASAPSTSKSVKFEPTPVPSDIGRHVPTAYGINSIKLIREEIKKAGNVNAIDEMEELEPRDNAENEDVIMREETERTISEGVSERTLESRTEASRREEELLQRRLNIEQEVTFLGENKAIAFVPSWEEPELADLPDEFYELSVEEVRRLYRDLRDQASAAVDAPLLPATHRTQLSTESQSNHKHAVVRVQFPDGVVLQGVFAPTDTIHHVHHFISRYLSEPGTQFHLFTTPTREILKPDVSLLEAKFVPCVLMHFRWAGAGDGAGSGGGAPYLQPHVYSNQTSSEAAAMLASKYRAPVRRKLDSSSEQNRREPVASTSSSSKDGKLPKWFKLK